MSGINTGMSRYFGLVPSLYDSLPAQAVGLLEIAIYNRELGFHAKALSIFRKGLNQWLNKPIIVYEYAQVFLGQDKVKDAYTVLSTYISTVNNESLDQPEIRLLTLSLAFAEIYHLGRLERAIEEVNRTREWLKDIPVERYTDVQVRQLEVLAFSLHIIQIILFRSHG
jgi:predicted Zn-dependent protease